ncbi:MAG: class I SAM-dependent methyltransferase [Deltaproteobacteria bacterium]|nr:class I SAM-dependent methyltransferase [Deltaproteobacteria bacterium]
MTTAEEHNAYQRAYYGGAPRPAIAPVDTPYVRRHLEAVLAALGHARRGRILEVGAGEGRYTLLLHALGSDVTASDLSAPLLARLQARAPGLPTVVGDVLDLPRASLAAFDAVVGFFVLHHLHDLSAGFAALHRLLKPGGRAVFCEPNGLNPLFYLQILLSPRMTWRGDGGVRHMRPGVVERGMRAAGFVDVRTARFGLFPGMLLKNALGRRLEAALEPSLTRLPVCPAFQLFSASRGPRR